MSKWLCILFGLLMIMYFVMFVTTTIASWCGVDVPDDLRDTITTHFGNYFALTMCFYVNHRINRLEGRR